MTGRRRLGLVAAGATLLAAAPISSIFESWSWLMQCIVAVGLIAGAALLARTLRFPTWAQALSMCAALLISLTWMFPSGHEVLLPQSATFRHFADLMRQAGQDTRSYGVPVPDREGLLFITVLGIGAVAIVVDLLTVVARRPALAGLPMLAIYTVPVAIYIDSAPVLPFMVGAAGFLWLLVSDNVDRVRRFGRRFTGDGRDVDVWEPSPLAAAGRRLGAVGVLAAVLLPLLLPAMTGGLLSRLTQSGPGMGTGGSGGGRINLFASLSGQLTQTSTVELLRVRTNEQDPYYLRFGVADQLTNLGFGNRPLTGGSINRGLPDPRGGTAGGTFQQYHAEVEVTDDLRQTMLPVYSNTIHTADLGGGWSYDNNQQVIFSNRTTTKGKKFSFDYVRAAYSPAALRTALPLRPDNPIQMQYTNTPRDATVKETVANLIRGKTTEYDKVLALYEYFSKKNGFSYSLGTQAAANSTEIAAFLRNKVGYCQQYAAALAWMVRDAGVPARVAFGFTRGTRDGDSYVITNRNAHAWTEVYLQGFGWIPFDATPASGVPGATRTVWARDNDEVDSNPSSSSSAAPSGGNASAGAADPNAAQRGPQDPAAHTPGLQSGGGSSTGLLVAAGAAVLIALLLTPALRRAILRRHRHVATAPKATVVAGDAGPAGYGRDIVVTPEVVRARTDAHAAWDELIDTMIDFRMPIDPAETPRVTAQRLIKDAVLVEEPAAAATLLGTAEEQARYARRPMQGGELSAALSDVRRGLARSATRWTRLVAVLMPPSVLLRWRLAVTEAATRTVTAGGRVREGMLRFSPRRLLAGSRSR